MTAAQIDDELTASLTRVEQGIDTLAAHRDRLATALYDTVNHHLDDGPCWCPTPDRPMPAHAACLEARAALAAHAARTEGEGPR